MLGLIGESARMTVAEHLWFFAKLKDVGVPDKTLKEEINKSVHG